MLLSLPCARQGWREPIDPEFLDGMTDAQDLWWTHTHLLEALSRRSHLRPMIEPIIRIFISIASRKTHDYQNIRLA